MKCPIPIKDYTRIFRIVHSVSTSMGNVPGSACLFYNTIGAAIVEERFKISAKPVMGSAFICVHEKSDTVLSYSHLNNETVSSDAKAFHCWIQLDEHILDFTAPVYNESLNKLGFKYKIQRKMFQKKLASMSGSHSELHKEGDFYIEPNSLLTNQLLDKFLQTSAAGDLANICMYWHKKCPKKIPNKISIQNDLDEVTDITLSKLTLSGVW